MKKYIVQYLLLVILLSSCHGLAKKDYHNRITKVIARSVTWQDRLNKERIMMIKTEIAETGFKKRDMEVYYSAKDLDSVFTEGSNRIQYLKNEEALKNFGLHFLDSIAKGVALLREYNRDTTFFLSEEINFEIKKSLMKSQLALLEKYMLLEYFNEVGSSHCHWGYPVYAYLAFEKDTLMQGDSLNALLFMHANRSHPRFIIDRVGFGNTIVEADENPTVYRFSINPKAPVNSGDPEHIQMEWSANIFYTDTRTMEDKQTALRGKYVIGTGCK